MGGNFSDGAGYLVRGLRMLGHPRLRPFVIIPLIVNILIFGTLITVAIGYFNEYLNSWLSYIPTWLSWLNWLVWPVFIFLIALASGYLFTFVALLIASPFNALLAEKTEELVTGQPVQGPEGILNALLLVPRAVTRELGKFAYYLFLMVVAVVLVFMLGWIPFLAPALWLLLGAWMMAVQYVDYPMDNHQLEFADVKEILRERRLSSLGFGGLVALVSGIPVLNFFVVPGAVCGATLFWCEELRGKPAE